MLWLVIFVVAQIFKFILGPLAVLFYVNVIKRAWNFFFTETLHEWVYINYYSKGDAKYSNLYMKLCDKVKHNRTTLSRTGYKNILSQGKVRRLGNYLMLTAGIIVALWVGAFGLNQEYAMPAWVGGVTNEPNEAMEPDYPEINEPEHEPDNNDNNGSTNDNEEPPPTDFYAPGLINPQQFPPYAQVTFALTSEAGVDGARLRDGPGTDTTVIEMLWGYDLLIYLGYYVQDAELETLFWLKVRTPLGTEGYIASQLVEVVG